MLFQSVAQSRRLFGSIEDNCKVLDVLFASLPSYVDNRDGRQVISLSQKQKKQKNQKKIMFLLEKHQI
jgi:hypothetical protein